MRAFNHSISRRDFMRDGSLAAGALSVLPSPMSLFAKPIGDKSLPLGLLFGKEDLETIRSRTKHPLFEKYWQALVKMDTAGDFKFLQEEIDLHNHVRHIARAYTILEREAFVYLMSGDRRRGELAHLAVQRILEYPKWDYFIEGGKETFGLQRAPGSTIAMCLAYDWLGDVLSETERQEMLRQIGDKGCQPCYVALYGMRYPDRVKGWGFDPESTYSEERDFSRWPLILDKSNLKAVPMGALAIGLATLWGKDDRVEKWLEMVVHSYREFVKNFAADGSYNEGSSYWAYTASHLALLVEVLQRKAGLELFDAVNFPGMMEFILALQMPHKGFPRECVNFGDAGSSFESGIGFWIAKKSRDGLAQYVAENHSREHSHYALIWYDPTVRPTPPTKQEYFKHLDLDWIIARTGYQEDDLVVAMRSGGPSNHEHADRNSILLKAYGEVLLADVKHPPYDNKHPAWVLRTSPAHNTVMIDGKGHQYHDGKEGTNASLAAAKIVRKGDRGHYLFWASDATPAYSLVNEDVQSVTRTVIVFPEFPCIAVMDKLVMKTQPALFSARWHIENKDEKGQSTIGGETFIINRPFARFFAACNGANGIRILQDKVPVPEKEGIYPFVEVAAAGKAREPFLLMVGCPVKEGEANPTVEIKREQSTYRVTAVDKSKRLEFVVFDQGALPEFEVL